MRDFSTRRLALSIAVLLTASALACSGTSTSTPTAPGTSGGASSSNGGTSATTAPLTVKLTDSPFSDAKALLVTFSEVSVHNADNDSWQVISNTSRTCDLKQLNGPVDVLGVGSILTGHYTQVRLVVTSASIYFDNAASAPACQSTMTPPAGTSASVTVPSGEIKLNREFTVTDAGATMTLDFNGDQSVKQTGSSNGRGGSNSTNKYIMTPVISIQSVQ
jgi:hypothetical protein